jgi:hypothetical protein
LNISALKYQNFRKTTEHKQKHLHYDWCLQNFKECPSRETVSLNMLQRAWSPVATHIRLILYTRIWKGAWSFRQHPQANKQPILDTYTIIFSRSGSALLKKFLFFNRVLKVVLKKTYYQMVYVLFQHRFFQKSACTYSQNEMSTTD